MENYPINEVQDPFADIITKGIITTTMLSKIRAIKRKYIKLGFVHQIALYGVLKNNETKAETYRRIDIMLNAPLTHESFTRIYDFFNYIKPPAKYSIWIYGDEDKEIGEVWFVGKS